MKYSSAIIRALRELRQSNDPIATSASHLWNAFAAVPLGQPAHAGPVEIGEADLVLEVPRVPDFHDFRYEMVVLPAAGPEDSESNREQVIEGTLAIGYDAGLRRHNAVTLRRFYAVPRGARRHSLMASAISVETLAAASVTAPANLIHAARPGEVYVPVWMTVPPSMTDPRLILPRYMTEPRLTRYSPELLSLADAQALAALYADGWRVEPSGKLVRETEQPT